MKAAMRSFINGLKTKVKRRRSKISEIVKNLGSLRIGSEGDMRNVK